MPVVSKWDVQQSHRVYYQKVHILLVPPAVRGFRSKPLSFLSNAAQVFKYIFRILSFAFLSLFPIPFSLSLAVIFTFSLVPRRGATNKLQNKVGQTIWLASRANRDTVTDGAPNQCYLLSPRHTSFIPAARMIKEQQREGDSKWEERAGGGDGGGVFVCI